MNKKGFGFLVTVIIASIFIVLIVAMAGLIAKALLAGSCYNSCEITYKANYVTSVVSRNNFVPQFDMKCCTQRITFDKGGIYQENEREKKKQVVKFKRNERPEVIAHQIKNEIAEEMYLCAKQFSFGKNSIFSKWASVETFTGGESYCFKCATFEFTEKFRDTYPALSRQLLTPLALLNGTVPGQKFSYISKFNDTMTVRAYQLSNQPMDTKKDYEMIFVSTFGNTIIKDVAIGGAELVGLALLGTFVPGVGTVTAIAGLYVKASTILGAFAGKNVYFSNDFYLARPDVISGAAGNKPICETPV